MKSAGEKFFLQANTIRSWLCMRRFALLAAISSSGRRLSWLFRSGVSQKQKPFNSFSVQVQATKCLGNFFCVRKCCFVCLFAYLSEPRDVPDDSSVGPDPSDFGHGRSSRLTHDLRTGRVREVDLIRRLLDEDRAGRVRLRHREP